MPDILSRATTRGLVMSGRKTNLMIALEDKPGQLSLVSDIVGLRRKRRQRPPRPQ